MHIFKGSFRLTKNDHSASPDVPSISIWHGVLYSIAAIVVVLAFTFFLIIRREDTIAIPAALDFLAWVAFAGAGAFLYSKLNHRIGK